MNPPLVYSGQGTSWSIIDNILYITMFAQKNLLTDDEQIRLADIYQNHLNFYLKTYKCIDALSVSLEITVAYIKTGQNIREKPGYGRAIYEKYKLLGFEDLKYEFEEW
ncbi:hypothetical protein AGMMS49579_27170 [Spirochaetia bacterium]|nr:hypothetical protein AGMMS49579_27170 [Spirochaetia bacterium]